MIDLFAFHVGVSLNRKTIKIWNWSVPSVWCGIELVSRVFWAKSRYWLISWHLFTFHICPSEISHFVIVRRSIHRQKTCRNYWDGWKRMFSIVENFIQRTLTLSSLNLIQNQSLEELRFEQPYGDKARIFSILLGCRRNWGTPVTLKWETFTATVHDWSLIARRIGIIRF